MSNLYNYEKKEADLKKGVQSKEPDHELRLEEEDLIKMNLDDAIIDHSDEDEAEENEGLLETYGEKVEKPKPKDTSQSIEEDSVGICIEEWDNDANIIEQIEEYQSCRIIETEISGGTFQQAVDKSDT